MKLFELKEYDTYVLLAILGIRIKIRTYISYPFSRFACKLIQKFCRIHADKIIFINSLNWQYSCNPKYIVEELLNRPEAKKLNIIWLTNKQTRKELIPNQVHCVNYESFRALYELTTAKVWLTNAHMFLPFKKGVKKSPKTLLMQTYHGSFGIKKADADVKIFEDLGWAKWQKKACESIDYCFTASEFEKGIFTTAFWGYGNILKLGTARDSIFFKNTNHIIAKVKKYYKINSNHKIFLYAPTWRPDKRCHVYNVDIKLLKNCLEKRFGGEWSILIRSHYHMKKDIFSALYDENLVINCTEYLDMQELLVAADILMTDYSSCLPEFTILKKPCFIYATDIEKYENGFYYPLETLPSPIATNNYELAENILNFDEEIFLKKTERYLEQMGHKDDEYSCTRIVDFILSKMAEASQNIISRED